MFDPPVGRLIFDSRPGTNFKLNILRYTELRAFRSRVKAVKGQGRSTTVDLDLNFRVKVNC